MATVTYGKCYLWQKYYDKCTCALESLAKCLSLSVSILHILYAVYSIMYIGFLLYAVHCTLRVYLAHNTFPEKGTQSLKENSNYYRLEVKGQNWVE